MRLMALMLLLPLCWPELVRASVGDCQSLLDLANEIRALRDHDAYLGASRAEQELVAISPATRDACPVAFAQLLRARSVNLATLGQHAEAVIEAQQGLRMLESMSKAPPGDLADLHLAAGVALWGMEQHDRAIDHYLRSLQASQNAGDIVGAARAAGNLGNLYNSLGAWLQAEIYHQQALAGFEQADQLGGIAGTLINLAALSLRQAAGASAENNPELAQAAFQRAYQYSQRALQYFEALENPRGIAYAANNAADALEGLGDPEQALVYHRRALELRRQVGDAMGVVQSLITMSGTLQSMGDPEASAALLREAAQRTPVDSLALALDIAMRQVALAEELGDYRVALGHQKEVTQLRRAIADTEVGLRVEEVRMGFEEAQRERQLELLRSEAMIRDLQLERQRIAIALAATVAVGLLILLGLVFRLYRQGARAARALNVAARTDSLTGLPNRRDMDQHLDEVAAASSNAPQRALLMLIDIDQFKLINDRHGHQTGDEVLKHVAALLRDALPAGARIARWGGEEFLVLLPDRDAAQAERDAERLRALVAEQPLRTSQGEVAATITVGVAALGANVGSAIREADRALYQGKDRGRNQVVSHVTEPETASGS